MTRLIVTFLVSIVLVILGVYWKITPEFLTKEIIISKIEGNLEKEIQNWRKELGALANSPDSEETWRSVSNSFFLSDSSGVIRWTTNKYLPDPSTFDNDSIEYHRSGSNHYLVIQHRLNDNEILTGFLVLQESYAIQNQYLSATLNPEIFETYGVSFQFSNNRSPIHFHGRRLFSVLINTSIDSNEVIDWKAWILFSVGILLLLWATWNFSLKLNESKNRVTSVFLIFLTLLGVRLIMVYGNFPSTTSEISILDPREFASSTFNNSIGNLLLNTFFLFLVSVFTIRALRRSSFQFWKRQRQFIKLLGASVFFLLFFAAQLLPFLYLETIYHNSVITPDLSQQLSYNAVRLCALGCILLSNLTGIIFSLTFFRIAALINIRNNSLYAGSLIIASIVFLLYHFLTYRNYETPFLLTLINIFILIIATVNKKAKVAFAGLTSLILLQLIIYSAQTALEIRWLSIERERESMTKFGNTFLVERDVLGEYMLDQAISNIERDAFIQQQMVNPFNRLNAIEQKIRHSHLNSYFDRYDILISLFDNKGTNVGSDEQGTLTSLIKGFVPLAKNTTYKGIYMIKNPANRLIKRYLAVVPIKYYVSGYVVVDMTLRQVLPSAVFPKLLLDNRFSSYAKSSNYSYAIFMDDNLASSTGEFNYGSSQLVEQLNNRELFTQGITIDGFDHIGINRSGSQTTIISIRHYSWLNLLANFSFYFLLGISLVIVGLLVIYFASIRKNRLSYSNRIRIYVYLAMVLPLMVLAITTLRVNSFAETKRSEESSVRQARNLANSLVTSILSSEANVEETLSKQSLGLGVDVTVYSKKGTMIASSQPDIYGNQILSRHIDPQALNLIWAGNYSFTIDDKIGGLEFRNTYSAILGPDNKAVLGIVSLPFFASQESFEKDQIRLVINILAVFVVVFLLFYLLSYIALNWLVRPLRVVSTSLRQTTLSGANKKLEWNSSDEIGTMVKEYNNMIDNLAKSMEELERRQREATWREMARQVAHEIKNPLTPIKLTLQQLQRALQSDNIIPEQTSKSIDSVLHQVDILNDIASSFSAFAQMPEPKLERVNIVSLVWEVVSLYKNNQAINIYFDNPGQPVWAMTDKKLFSRIVSNIILNAIQSEKENDSIRVGIKLKVDTPNLTLLFKDNGVGMNKETMEKIFIPYFSTKDSGSGLGLAIAKQGVEQSGGSIWVESIPGEGTTFFIALPVVN